VWFRGDTITLGGYAKFEEGILNEGCGVQQLAVAIWLKMIVVEREFLQRFGQNWDKAFYGVFGMQQLCCCLSAEPINSSGDQIHALEIKNFTFTH
jgi:hypothetical protein